MQPPCEFWSVLSLGHVKTAFEARQNLPVSAAYGRRAASLGDALQEIGVAVVPIVGVIAPGSWGDVSPQEISSALSAAERSSARTVVLDINSPGGAVSGVPELSDQIYALRQRKRVIASTGGLMASAAFWLGSQAHEIVASRSAELGSVGVVVGHVDVSEAERQAGIKVTTITSADSPFKAEGDSSAPLSDAARAHIQSQVDRLHEMFVADIARGRGISPASVKSGYGKGRTMFAAAALKAGMVDRVQTMQQVIDGLARDAAARAERGLAAFKVSIGVDPDEPWSVRKEFQMRDLLPPSLLDGNE